MKALTHNQQQVSTPPKLHPPSFNEAKNRRQKVRSAGMNPDYWYAVEYDRAIKPGQVIEVKFWNTSIALYRTGNGQLVALENRCAHRQLVLSLGQVNGDRLVCCYHGWGYNKEGRVVDIPHDLFDKPMPVCKIRTYPVQVRYGLIWIFPGDSTLADKRQIPKIPELEGKNRWACVPLDFTWQAHHSMIIDNVSDFTHAYLHRRYRPFTDAKLIKCKQEGDKVFVSYETKVGTGKVSGMFVDRKRVNTNFMELCYEYPYQWSNTDNKIKHWCFILPISEQRTRVFFLFYFDALIVPFTKIKIPQWLMTSVLKIANPLLIKPLLAQDGVAVEAEQNGYNTHFNAPIIELNPAVHLFQLLTIRKWEEYLGLAEKVQHNESRSYM
ncbi:aromatic ring-hydroxylating oxygenase subunit alpha [Calothrix rhizosoleniae]|uniref:aromatic ring-hydroxylating oxygenase subunit alpha n=1 Tax=Calothrix rhizosoleniae TaxID=888997 RepID=UPI000B499B49|nr:aromatic ring-hydroxylating dioxygenase subunit alpha [Calothrix rhizosoleniae]